MGELYSGPCTECCSVNCAGIPDTIYLVVAGISLCPDYSGDANGTYTLTASVGGWSNNPSDPDTPTVTNPDGETSPVAVFVFCSDNPTELSPQLTAFDGEFLFFTFDTPSNPFGPYSNAVDTVDGCGGGIDGYGGSATISLTP